MVRPPCIVPHIMFKLMYVKGEMNEKEDLEPNYNHNHINNDISILNLNDRSTRNNLNNINNMD